MPEKVYAKSIQVYMMDPEKRKQYEEETEKLRDKYIKHEPKPMTKEQVLTCVKRLEQFKFEA